MGCAGSVVVGDVESCCSTLDIVSCGCNGCERKTYEHYDVEQGVGAESVCAVYANACCFSCSIQTINDVVLPIFDIKHLTAVIRWDTAHTVVHSRQYWDRLLRDIDACKDRCCFSDTRQPLMDDLLRQVR